MSRWFLISFLSLSFVACNGGGFKTISDGSTSLASQGSGSVPMPSLSPTPMPTLTPAPTASPTPKPSPTMTPVTPTPAPTATPQGSCVSAPTSSTVVNVKDSGARGDGKTDDTAAIQSAVNQVQDTGGTVLVPAGTYMVDATVGIQLGNKMTFRMDPGAILQVITNNVESYDTVMVQGKSNVNIIGGSIVGDRSTHKGSTGEWGMGISIYGGSSVVIESVVTKELWGDGVYVAAQSQNITVCSVTSDHNRRQGMSVVSADGVTIKNSIFENTQGTDPQSGIDLEPNTGETVNNVSITGSHFLNNYADGFEIYGGSGPVTNVILTSNSFSGNGFFPVELYLGASGVTISNNSMVTSTYGVDEHSGISNITVTGNMITGGGTAIGHEN